MYKLKIDKKVYDIFKKKKNKSLLKKINKKIEQIKRNPKSSKFLTGNYKGCLRAKLGKKYRLIYTIDEKNKIITLLDFGNRKNIYREGAIEIALSNIKKSREKSP